MFMLFALGTEGGERFSDLFLIDTGTEKSLVVAKGDVATLG